MRLSKSKVLLLVSIVIVGLFILVLTVWRNSTPEITNLAVSTSVDSNNKPINPTFTFKPTDDIYVSGRLAHTDKTTIKLELNKDQESISGYPKTFEISVPSYPNNYFYFKLEKPIVLLTYPEKKVWEVGEYELKVYPKDCLTPFKPVVKFKVSKDQESLTITEEEKAKIDRWIIENNLNQYGDPKNRIYTGGTPLFNEATGETIDRYEYILKNHPNRPWKNK